MFRNKSDDPKTDRIITIFSATAGIGCCIILYFFIFSNIFSDTSNINLFTSIGIGILIYFMLGIFLTVHVTKKKLAVTPRAGHSYNHDRNEKRWEALEVTEE